MTDKEMIILKSCLRYIHQEALNSNFYPNNLTKEELDEIQNSSFEGGGIQSEELPYHILGDIRAVIYNYHAGVFDNKIREEYRNGNYSFDEIISTLHDLIKKADECDESFNGAMII